MSIKRANRITPDGTTVTITFGRRQVACLKATYGDALESSDVTAMGSQQIDGQTPGSYKTDEVSVTMEYATWSAEFMPNAQKDGFGNERLPLVVTHFHPDLGDDSDLLDACRYMGTSAPKENSNAVLVVELKFKTPQIYWTNARKTINQLDLSHPLVTSKF